mmetsp:Transcript_32065/g.42515  ORF Transcript_32065/g.42515 Transcript_32065/m.42515 type:complete len:159 (-) Transcript_32065:160-636(-)
MFTFIAVLTCHIFPREPRRHRAIGLGRARLEKALDVVGLARQRRKLKAAIRLLFTSDEISLLGIQRCDNVLEPDREVAKHQQCPSTSSDDIAGKTLKAKPSILAACGPESGASFGDRLRRGVVYVDERNPTAESEVASLVEIEGERNRGSLIQDFDLL